MHLTEHKKDWDELGALDPCWAILVDPARRFGRWDVEEFFRTGEREIKQIVANAKELKRPANFDAVMDFGCGVGRLTRALAGYFRECYGVDISESMLSRAREMNAQVRNCKFILNTSPDLKQFPEGAFDMIYTGRVLQHMPSKAMIFSYISEFVRILRRDGLLVFQCPAKLPMRYRLQPKRRLYHALRSIGIGEVTLYRKLGLIPMRVDAIPQRQMLNLLEKQGATLLRMESDLYCGPSVPSFTYYATKLDCGEQGTRVLIRDGEQENSS